jgi:hypothetical protein
MEERVELLCVCDQKERRGKGKTLPCAPILVRLSGPEGAGILGSAGLETQTPLEGSCLRLEEGGTLRTTWALSRHFGHTCNQPEALAGHHPGSRTLNLHSGQRGPREPG